MGKQRPQKETESLFGITRDGDLIGVGMTRVNAEITISELSGAYPENEYRIIPNPKGKKVNP